MRNDFESNYLCHHGILGQKWGVRRYQNADGSLTEAGKKHYKADSVDKINTSEGYNKRIKDVKKAIKINDKKRGKEYTKIANNPENFLGMNKKHAKKIEEYSENIKKGEEEIARLLAKAGVEGYITKNGKVKDTEASIRNAIEKAGYNADKQIEAYKETGDINYITDKYGARKAVKKVIKKR